MTAFIEWSDELSVGIQEIDEQHKVLVGLVNELHDAIREHHGNEVSRKILDRLGEYTRIHFAVEESLMRIMGYPDYESHLNEHQQLADELGEIVAKVDSGKGSVSMQLIHFLKIWLTKHIMESDKDYSPFFLNKGISAKAHKDSWFKKLWS